MKIQKKRRPGIAAAIVGTMIMSLLFTGCGQPQTASPEQETSASETEPAVIEVDTEGAKPAGKKSEIVSAKADAAGNIESISAEITLSDPVNGVNILETTNLSDLKNTVGDEEYVILSDGRVVFENKGEDITYKGNASEELPVSVKVTYYLNGQETDPDRMAGASGDIKIRFDYENKTTEDISIGEETITTPVPFLAISAVAMDPDVFTDIEVTNGNLVNMDGSRIAVGYALPGLADVLDLNSYEMFEDMEEIPAYVEISAHTEKFSLDFTETILMNSLFSSLEEDAFDDADELSDSMKELQDASGEILDGITELDKGLSEFSGYLTTYTDGVSALSTGITQLQSGVKALNENKTALKTGADALASGLAELRKAVNASSDLSTRELTEAMTGLGNDLAVIHAQAAALNESAAAAGQYVEDALIWQGTVLELVGSADSDLAAIDTTELPEEAIAGIANARASLASVLSLSKPQPPQLSVDTEELSGAAASLQSHMAVISAAGESLSGLETSMTNLQTAVDQLADGSAGLVEGIGSFNSGIEQLAQGADRLASGTSKLSSAGPELQKAMKQVVDGTGELKKGYKKFHREGIQELADTLGKDVPGFLNKCKALQRADARYSSYSGSAEGQETSVVFMIETEEIK